MAQQKVTPVANTPPPVATPFQPEDWQEADFIRALASLERLQTQLDQIRKVPANLISPFRTAQTREKVFTSFTTATQTSFSAIADLKTVWEEPKTAQLLQQCARTPNKNVELAIQHNIGIWGWNEREKSLSDAEAPAETKVAVVRNSEEDEETASELYGPEFEQFQWKDEQRTQLAVTVKRPGVWLRFEVKRRSMAEGLAYEAHCVGDSKESEAISRCLFRREGQQDIFDTLEMLLAYGSAELSRADCDHCGKYREGTGATPCARRKKTAAKADDEKMKSDTKWIPLHESCL